MSFYRAPSSDDCLDCLSKNVLLWILPFFRIGLPGDSLKRLVHFVLKLSDRQLEDFVHRCCEEYKDYAPLHGYYPLSVDLDKDKGSELLVFTFCRQRFAADSLVQVTVEQKEMTEEKLVETLRQNVNSFHVPFGDAQLDSSSDNSQQQPPPLSIPFGEGVYVALVSRLFAIRKSDSYKHLKTALFHMQNFSRLQLFQLRRLCWDENMRGVTMFMQNLEDMAEWACSANNQHKKTHLSNSVRTQS